MIFKIVTCWLILSIYLTYKFFKIHEYMSKPKYKNNTKYPAFKRNDYKDWKFYKFYFGFMFLPLKLFLFFMILCLNKIYTSYFLYKYEIKSLYDKYPDHVK